MTDGHDVEVRAHRGERQLMVGGTHASVHQPGRLLSGSVWDALAAPVALLQPSRRKRILILGLGGGTAARIVRAVAPEALIVGVEISADVVRHARKDLELDAIEVEVIIADARAFVREDKGRKWDMIVEDCFPGGENGLEKPPWMLSEMLPRLGQRLNREGVLVANAIHDTTEVRRRILHDYESVISLTPHDCVNQVFVGSRGIRFDARSFRAALRREPKLRAAARTLKVRTEKRV